jgi:hypothetical protein
MSINIEVTMEVRTCLCGTCYALPHWIQSYQCPTCAGQKYRALQERFDELYLERNRLKRVVRGLRGAMKIAKRRH